MKLKHLRFAGLLFGALFLCPAHAQTPSGSVSRSTWVNTTLGQCFPTNNQGLITASVLRNCMTTLADSVLFSQSALSDLPTGPSTMPSGFTYPSPFVSGTFTVNGSSSGAAAIVAQAAAGSPTLTLPTGSGTFAVSASSPLSLNTTTGALTCATCQTTAITGSSPINVTGGVVSLQGASGTLAQGSGGTGSTMTATPTLGVAGSTLGTLTFANLTSGGITLSPPTGALGSVTLTLPDTSTTLAGLGIAQTFSAAQTFGGGVTLSGLSSGTCNAGIVLNSSNQIVTGACPGAASSIMVGGTTVTSASGSNYLLTTGSVTGGTGTLANETITTALGTLATSPTTSKVTTTAHTGGFSANGFGTYTTPAGVLWIRLTIIGGGGGGGGGNNASVFAGNGGASCWNTSGAACTSPLLSAGGGGGSGGGSNVGTPGAISGSLTCNLPSAAGSTGFIGQVATTTANGPGGQGAPSSLAGGGFGSGTTTGGNGPTDSGAGAGGGVSTSSGTFGGDGGSSGATCSTIILNPAASYTYVAGAAGTGAAGGTGGSAGGNGAGGQIVVEEHYMY